LERLSLSHQLERLTQVRILITALNFTSIESVMDLLGDATHFKKLPKAKSRGWHLCLALQFRCTYTSHSPRFALAIHFSELVAINILFNAGAYL